MAANPIAVVDIGTDRVRVIVGEFREDGHIVVIGLGSRDASGVRKSEIRHFEQVLTCVRAAVADAEEQSHSSINIVCLLLSGSHIQSMVNRGTVPIFDPSHEIMEEDVDQVSDAARNVTLAEDREIIHTVPQHFYVDDQAGVLSPVGMEGAQLALDALIIHGDKSRARNTAKVVRTANLEIEDAAFSGLCAALAVLDAEQKESGVLHIDLGAGTTDYIVYTNKCMSCAGSVGVGSEHVTNDIRLGLQLSNTQAEQLKRDHGSALVRYRQQSRNIAVPPASDLGTAKNIRLNNLNTIINVRLEELFRIIKTELEERELLHHLGAGVVLTGGGARMKDVCELAEQVFNLHCEVGRPRDITGLGLSVDAPELASALGMLRYQAMIEPERTQARPKFGRLLSMLVGRNR